MELAATSLERLLRRLRASEGLYVPAWFTHGVPGGSGLRKAIFEAKSGQAVLGEVERFFDSRANAPEPESFTLEHDPELESAPAAWG